LCYALAEPLSQKRWMNRKSDFTSDVPLPGVKAPIAVIGMACRFPGAGSVAELWELLRNGVDATSDTPTARYDVNALYSPMPTAGKVNSRRAGYLLDADQFDASFFGLSEKEAKYLDPQQRLLMMTAWEALEDAGVLNFRGLSLS
jgi:acyl transferase domain-containing protein